MGAFAMPLLAVGFLVGSWLLFPRMDEGNDVFDSGAEEMPRINQALRGVTQSQLFGTNRVSSNITWTKNWSVERHESSGSGGGGKGGGSGGSKQPENPGAPTYTYTWDIMVTLGMVPERYSLYGGWMNQERLNDDTIGEIGQDLTVFSYSDPNNVPEEAHLEFADAFYHGGAPTTATSIDNWDYWETQEGYPCRWPHVAWIGFQTLQLGNKPALPSLEWEIGPGEANIDFLTGFIDQAASNSSADAQAPNVHQFIVGDDGNFYTVGIEETEVAYIQQFDVDAGTYGATDTLNETQFDADVKANGGPDSGHSYDVLFTASMIQNSSKYFLAWGFGLHPDFGIIQSVALGLYKIDSAGLAVMVGLYMTKFTQTVGTLGALQPNPIDALAIANEGLDSDPLVVVMTDQYISTITPRTGVWPSINDMLFTIGGGTGPLIKDSAAGSTEYRAAFRSFNGATVDGVAIGLNFCRHVSDRFGDSALFGWFMPKAIVTQLGVDYETTLNFYIGKAAIQWHDDNPGASYPTLSSQYIYDTSATYPNGHAFKLDYGELTWGTTPPSPTTSIINTKFIDQDTLAVVMPFDDEGTSYDGSVETDSGYSSVPTVQKVPEGVATGMYAVMWGKVFLPSLANSTTGELIKIRGFLYRPDTETYEQFDDGEGTTLDTVDDLGQTELNRYKGAYYNVMPVWDTATGTLYKVGFFHGAISYPPGDVHISVAAHLDVSGVGDVLPPYVIYEILTNTTSGTGTDAADIDTSSYEAALTYCRNESFFISVQYMREQSKLGAIEELLALYGGYLTISGGKIYYGIVEHTSNPVRTLDNSHLVREGDKPPVSVTISAKDDSYNKVLVNYFDRTLEYRQNQVQFDDEVDQDLNGIRKKEFPAKFVMAEAMANKIAVRALWSNLYGKDTFNWSVSDRDSDLEAGDVITLVDSFHPKLSAGNQVRITAVSESRRGKYDMVGITEIQYISASSAPAIGVGSGGIGGREGIYGPARVPASQTAYELPREFYGSDPKVFVGYNQLSASRGATLYLSEDGISYALVTQAEPYIISGIFDQALPTRPDGYMEQGVEFYLMPSSGFSTTSPTYVQTHTLEDTGVAGRGAGLQTIIVGSEAMAYQGITLKGQNHYRVDRLYRGWGGTHIQGHSSGNYWHKHGGGIFGIEYNQNQIGTTIYYKVVPYNFAGQAVDVASVEANTYTITGEFFRPQIQGNLHWSADSVENGQSSIDMRANQYLDVLAGGTLINFNWANAAQMSGFGTQGYGTGGYGRFTADTTSRQYRVEVLSNDLTTVVRCLSTASEGWTYTVNNNSTDFTGWSGDFQVKLTPYNEFGDAPRVATKRVRAF